MEFVDRLLTCTDCRTEFVFTAGEQLFFYDKQFKNDPKRCKPCKSKRSVGTTAGAGPAAAGISRTETRTECSECGIETTVPFKPTQGRPVLCRMCFQKQKAPSTPVITESSMLAAQAAAANDQPVPEVQLEPAPAVPVLSDHVPAADALPAMSLIAAATASDQKSTAEPLAAEMAQA